MSKFKKTVTSLSFNLIASEILFLLLFAVIIGCIGYVSFTDTLKKEYKETTYHMTNTATTLIDGSKINKYLNDEELENYEVSYGYLKKYCNYMNVTLIHVFVLDQSNYTDAVNVLNVVNDKELEAGNYKEWQIKYEFGERYTKNYKDVYEKVYKKEIEYGTVYRTKNLKGKEAHITTIVPILDNGENVVALLSIQRPMSEYAGGVKPYVITTTVSSIGLIAFMLVLSFIVSKYKIVKPIGTVIEEARYFSKEKEKGKNLDKNYSLYEINDLKQSIVKMEDDMLSYIDSITKYSKEKQRASAELNIAHGIQSSMVPSKFPAFPDRKDFDLYALMTPAKEVGGDFYNFLLIDENHLALVMADVSGKGVPASLFMMITNILTCERLIAGDSPKDALAFVNNRICRHNETNMFVTMWAGVLDLTTGEMVACNAGHDDPVIYRKGKSFEINKTKHNIIVGAMNDTEFTNYEIKLEKGDKLFLYTDGIPEATNANNELFNLDRMVDSLNKVKKESPKEIIEKLKKDVDKFVGNAPQFDDITMLLLELKED